VPVENPGFADNGLLSDSIAPRDSIAKSQMGKNTTSVAIAWSNQDLGGEYRITAPDDRITAAQ
jgi:hypothetical protein